MRDQQKLALSEKATQLIEEIVAKNLSQKDIATLVGSSTSTLSKLKSIEYLPKNAEELIQKLNDLKVKLDTNPDEAIGVLHKSPSQEKNKSIFFYSGLYTLCIGIGLGLGYLLFSSTKANKSITIKEAFETIFQSDMRIEPYAKDLQLPCYRLQKRWQMDNEQPYTIVVPLMDAVYYYRSKTVDLYAWCQVGDSTGNYLEALELFTNELWKDKQRRMSNYDSLKNLDFSHDPSFIKLADINSLFSDVIKIEEDSITEKIHPISRNGKQIARYEAAVTRKEYSKEVNMVIDHYISCFSKTNCHSLTLSTNHPDRDFTLRFDCTFFESANGCNIPEQRYSKVIWK
jgi:hypothetical protein